LKRSFDLVLEAYSHPGQHAKDRGLRGHTLRMTTGEVTALVGLSGVGKSTLLRLINAKLVQVGQIAQSQALPCIYHHQSTMLLPWRTVQQNIELGGVLSGITSNPQLQSTIKLLGLDTLVDRYPSQMSGGQAERVALARTLSVPARTYLFDEPLAATDYPLRVELEQFFVDFARASNSVCIVVTHDIPFALAMAKTIWVMRGTPEGAEVVSVEPSQELSLQTPFDRRAHHSFGLEVSAILHSIGGR
jgi:ABC-type nitrate/sulfonate/bicarbonate transport system ATPase subunit